MDKPQFVYVTYIASTPEKVWEALIDPAFTRDYWNSDNVSDWKPGSEWKNIKKSNGKVEIVGKVVESDRPRRLVLTWSKPAEADDASKTSQVAIEIEAAEQNVKLTVTHSNLDAAMLKSISGGWPIVLSGLKSQLERGESLNIRW